MRFPRVVYVIENTVTKRKYVGSTSDTKMRFYQHMSMAQSGKHSVPLMNEDFKQYGFDSFDFKLLDVINTFDEREKEYEWQKRLNTQKPETGYNYLDLTVRRGKGGRKKTNPNIN